MDPNYPVFANTLETYDAYFQDDRERYIRSYQEYEQYMALCEQEAGGSGSGTGSRSSPKKRAYIPRQRETAEERLIDDYFGDEEIDPKYTEENFRRRYQAVADQRLWIWHAYFGVPGANNDLNVLYGSPLFDDELAGTAPECPFEVNGHIYNKGYYLADGIYPTWSVFVKTFSVAKTEKTLKFKRIQESSRKDIERAFGVLQGRWGIIRQPARAFEINALKRIMYCCVMLHNMILEDEDFVVNLRDVFVDPTPDIPQEWTERCDLHVRKHKELRDSKVHNDLRDDLVEHVWNRNY
ncbi:ALP1-like protein isoform X1 [Tanacetum coccineum]